MLLDALLAPIAGPQPCGEDLSFSHELDQITELRREDDPTLAQGDWVAPLKVADWPGVAALCEQLLAERSKDLRLAMWLTEAWTIERGYTGLLQGLRLCEALCARYWDGLYPTIDDGDADQRIGNVRWLLQKTVQLADSQAVTQGRPSGAYSLRDLKLARHQQQSGSASSESAAGSSTLTPEQFMRALKSTPAEHLRAQLTALQDVQSVLRTWQDFVDAQLGADGPSFVAAKEALANAEHEVQRLMREAGVSLTDGPSAAAMADLASVANSDAQAAGANGSQMPGPITSRAQALQQLREVAAYFRRTEPHSPVAYLADKAVRWGDMPLHEWLRQVVKDQGAMSHLEVLLGLEPPGDGGAA